MLPFSVLRTWGLGLFSWFLIGLGAYCIWKWNDLRQKQKIPIVQSRVEVDGRQPVERELKDDGDADKATIFLVAGLAFLGTSGLGFITVTLLLGRPGNAGKNLCVFF